MMCDRNTFRFLFLSVWPCSLACDWDLSADDASSSDEDDVGRAGSFAARSSGQVANTQQKVSIQPSIGVKNRRKRMKSKVLPPAKQ